MKKSNWIKVERYSAAKCPLQNQYCADPMESNWDILGYSAEPILSSGITLELFAPYVARPRKPTTEIFRRKLRLWWTVLWTPLWWTRSTATTTECQMTLLDTCLCLQTKWAFAHHLNCVCHFVETWQFWRWRRWSSTMMILLISFRRLHVWGTTSSA